VKARSETSFNTRGKWTVTDVGVYTEPYEIWLRPNIPDDLGPLPISYNLIRPPMDVDVRGIESLFDEVHAIVSSNAGCYVCGPGTTITGTLETQTVELAVKQVARPPLQYRHGF
jgi:hypothetical protein